MTGRRPLVTLSVLALASLGAYAAVARVGRSLHAAGPGGLPLPAILGLFGVAFGGYAAAIRVAVGARQDGRLLALIVAASVAFRITLLFSDPIAEVDLYRYLWDGSATLAGVDPFRYSPAEVLAAPARGPLPADLARLVALRDGSAVTGEVLRRVHFGELTTIYPPVAQAVFALAAGATPRGASLPVRMTVMKAWFVGFDLATLGLVVALLRFSGRPVGWSLAYGWCPLLVKEVANSGHLDALAAFLATLSLYLGALALYPPPPDPSRPSRPRRSRALTTAAALTLALAAGAKLYPVVLAPLLGISLARRRGWRSAVAPAAAFVVALALVVWPMLPADRVEGFDRGRTAAGVAGELPPLPPLESFSDPRDPGQGLTAFLSQWEMNDFLFLIVVENLRPYADLPPRERAWFSVVPERWREAVMAAVPSRAGVERRRLPFFLTRAATSSLFLILALGFAWRGSAAAGVTGWLRAAFLTLAWFWLLQPTLNPWYWAWALPLVPFARNRAWLAVSGLVFLYYLRFWLTDRFPEAPVPGSRYPGPLFFDFVVTWIEFGPWFAWLALETRRPP